ncbi:MAG TPA: lactate utilization protein [Terriglobia bacterium]|nr:lactate utilization protein [Terriglobia bacterium]
MSTREEMLDRVRKALGRPDTGSLVTPLPPLDLTGVMPPLAPDDYLTKFEAGWEKVAGIAYRVSNMDELEAVFRRILVLAETQSVALSGNPLLAELGITDRLSPLNKFVTSWPPGVGVAGTDALTDFNNASFAAGAGITGVDFVLAESGTLVLSSATERVQMASLAPPIHIALYRRSQLVGSLDEVLARLPISNSPDCPTAGRSVVFITGTSRTADIEQILIKGVHGPREAHAILVEDSCR